MTTSKTQAPAYEKYERLLERAKRLAPLPTAVAHRCDDSSLAAAVDAARIGLIAPLLASCVVAALVAKARSEDPSKAFA